MEQISNDLMDSLKEKMQTDSRFLSLVKEREKLPVFSCRNNIMEAINENPVVLIKGNTGCGKTTQVIFAMLNRSHLLIVL